MLRKSEGIGRTTYNVFFPRDDPDAARDAKNFLENPTPATPSA